jgi:uncharacterized protein (TIGR00661 family)
LFNNKIIFYSVLDWGWGHATRSIPIIMELKTSNQIILGVTPKNKQFFNLYFPELIKVDLPSYNIKYSRWYPVWLKLIFQWPFIQKVVWKENNVLRQIIKDKQVNVVISDSRFGLHNNKTHSVIISHQLTIQSPILKKLANKINLYYLKKFDEIWVPDYESPIQRLSGELSSFSNLNVKFINPRSLLTVYDNASATQHNIDYLILLSGIEPQREILEKLLLKYFENTRLRVVMVRGTDSPIDFPTKNIDIFNFISGSALAQTIHKSTRIVCRSGYSTLMDLHLLGKQNLTLIPTPGQTEQEYLARYWEIKFNAKVILQTDLKKNKAKLLD